MYSLLGSGGCGSLEACRRTSAREASLEARPRSTTAHAPSARSGGATVDALGDIRILPGPYALAFASVKRWDLSTLPPSTEKQTPREPGPDAPRVPRRNGRIPRVLFSAPECRTVVVELGAGEAMGDHTVRERVVLHVSGRVSVEVAGEEVECGTGTVLTFDPGERHAVRAIEPSTLLLVLAPWPAAEHYAEGDPGDAGHVPANASVEPIPSPRADA